VIIFTTLWEGGTWKRQYIPGSMRPKDYMCALDSLEAVTKTILFKCGMVWDPYLLFHGGQKSPWRHKIDLGRKGYKKKYKELEKLLGPQKHRA